MKNKSVIVILTDTEGNFILQDRDDKPGIINPGEIALFGGTIEKGETPLLATARELREELGIEIDNSRVEEFDKFSTTHDNGGERDVTVLVYRDVDVNETWLKEGKGIVIIQPEEIGKLPRLGNKALEILQDYNKKVPRT